jgi:dsDNA-specific endonuclease/ATPase MutS2
MDPSDMPDHEKFLTQMHHFEQRLNHALTHKYIQITFIHGVGTGRLKEAIRKELTEYNLSFEDGAFHKYGVGATVVNLIG